MVQWRVKLRLPAFDTPSRIDEPELIDEPSERYADFRKSMADVQRANRFLGGTAVFARQMRRWLREAAPGAAPLTLLDVATGSADLPRVALELAAERHVSLQVLGLDFSPPILQFAREESSDLGDLRLLRGDAFRLPLADRSVDYATCSLAFHHFGFEGSCWALAEMERVTRRGWLVNDLRRAWSAGFLISGITALIRANRMTRHDGPASVLRAYSVAEYAAMPAAIGLRSGTDVRLERSLFYRVALIRDKRSPDGR